MAAHIGAGLRRAMAPLAVAEALGGYDRRVHAGGPLDEMHRQPLPEYVEDGRKAAGEHGGDVAPGHGDERDPVGARRAGMIERPEPRQRLEQEMPEMVTPHPGIEPAARQVI